jgi:predicted small secreted protein
MKIILALLLMLTVTACSTVAGMGKDITGAAEWTKEKVTQPKQEPAK